MNADAKKLKTKNKREKTECEAIILWIVIFIINIFTPLKPNKLIS